MSIICYLDYSQLVGWPISEDNTFLLKIYIFQQKIAIKHTRTSWLSAFLKSHNAPKMHTDKNSLRIGNNLKLLFFTVTRNRKDEIHDKHSVPKYETETREWIENECINNKNVALFNAKNTIKLRNWKIHLLFLLCITK